MSNRKFQELNLSDDFLFPAALEDPITCRLVLECIIEEKIGELEVKVEYTKKYNSEFKYIRLDVYAKDSVTKLSYNLEMQNKDEHNLPLRSRYYQSQIDIGNLKPGEDYRNLKPVYVIFICNFDPFDQELYRYTFSMQCEERGFILNDGAKRIFLSTKGKNESEVPTLLLDFLGYLNDSTDEYVEYNPNEKIKEIHGRIKEMKKNRDVEARYMHYLYVDKLIEEKEKEAEDAKKKAEEAKKDAEEAKKKSIKIVRDVAYETVKNFGMLSEAISERIKNENDVNVLKLICEMAIKSDSVEQLENQIANL